MIISELFGPTLQGEGPNCGQPCGFIRLGRCNLTCSWCDTPYTWDWNGQNGRRYDPATELKEWPVEKVAAKLLAMNVPRVVITGGEPMIQRGDLTELTRSLHGEVAVEIETNGTLAAWPELIATVQQFNVSVKLVNSGVDHDKRIVANAIESFPKDRTIFKFVVASPNDFSEIESIQEQFDIDDTQIWIMPESTTAEDTTTGLQAIAPLAIERRWNVTPRLHVLIWGDQRGV